MGADLILWDDWSISIRKQKAWTSPRSRMEIQAIQGRQRRRRRRRNVKDLKEMGHQFLPGCVCSCCGSDSHVLPLKPGGHTVGSCSSVAAPQCATRKAVLLNSSLAERIPTITHTSIFMSCSVFQRWVSFPFCYNGQRWFHVWECLCSEGLLRV